MELREVREGLASLLVPEVEWGKGPGKDTGLPFYNPTMEKNRDMTVLFLRSLGKPGIRVLDGLAAAGSLGIRVALEVPGALVTCNDRNSLAIELVRKNAELNNVRLEEVLNEGLQAHLFARKYDFVDIDPFGTPVPYLDPAFQTIPHGMLVAVTATDTAVLCGAHAKACVRRYEARPLDIDCCKEIGLRILIGFCARLAARYDRAVTPLISFGTDHYFRTFLRVEKGAKRAEEMLSQIGHVAFDHETGNRWLATGRPTGVSWAGPLWTGSLLDGNVVSSLRLLDYMGHDTAALVETLRGEVSAPTLYVTVDFLGRQLRLSPPRTGQIIEALTKEGFIARRTHFNPLGIKTDASWKELTECYRELSP